MRDESEFADYVARAEQRLAGAANPLAAALRAEYETLKVRFAWDLGEGRDELVSRAGALMLAEAMLRRSGRE